MPAVTGSTEGLYGLLLVLQQDEQTLAERIERLVTQHPDSPLVTDIAAVFGASPVANGPSVHEVLQRPEWADFVPGRKLARFQESINATAEQLVIEGIAHRMSDAGLIDTDEWTAVVQAFSCAEPD